MKDDKPIDTDKTKSMIISKTPLRITFVGGGTDLPAYYKRYGPGAVTNCAIDKYIYVIIHKNFDNLIRVSYSKIEKVNDVNKIEHPTVREALKLLGITGGVDITSMADVPAVVGGLGLGSSYSFLVGVLNALHAWKGELASPKQLAEEATKIELEMLKGSSGKQDQYIAAFGGMRFFEFGKDGETVVKSLVMDQETKEKFRDHLLLMHTGREHHTEQILKKQSDVVKDHVEAYNKMRDYAYEMYDMIAEGKWHDVGKMMHENWLLKKSLSTDISDPIIDGQYERAQKAGAIGGKLIGAGGGGFLMFFADPENHKKIIDALPELKPVPFDFEPSGSRIISLED